MIAVRSLTLSDWIQCEKEKKEAPCIRFAIKKKADKTFISSPIRKITRHSVLSLDVVWNATLQQIGGNTYFSFFFTLKPLETTNNKTTLWKWHLDVKASRGKKKLAFFKLQLLCYWVPSSFRLTDLYRLYALTLEQCSHSDRGATSLWCKASLFSCTKRPCCFEAFGSILWTSRQPA